MGEWILVVVYASCLNYFNSRADCIDYDVHDTRESCEQAIATGQFGQAQARCRQRRPGELTPPEQVQAQINALMDENDRLKAEFAANVGTCTPPPTPAPAPAGDCDAERAQNVTLHESNAWYVGEVARLTALCSP